MDNMLRQQGTARAAYAGQSEDEDDWGTKDDEEEDDELASLSDGSSVPTTVASATDERVAAAALLAQKEANRIMSAKIFVLTMFLVLTVVASLTMYGYSNFQENDKFELEFEGSAQLLADGVASRLNQLSNALSALGVSISSYAAATDASWPTVTVPFFQTQVSLFLEQNPFGCASPSLDMTVFVDEDERLEWEAYALNSSQDWIEEATEALGSDAEVDPTDITPFIFRVLPNGTKYSDPGDFENEDAVFAPVWMTSLTDPDAIERVNYNMYDDKSFGGFVSSLSEDPTTCVVGVPSSTANSIVATGIVGGGNTTEMVGSMMFEMEWDALLSGILSEPNGGPMVVVLENSCGRNLMFEVDEVGAAFIHSLTEVDLPVMDPVSSFPLDDVVLVNGCSIVLHIGPSVEMKEAYGTNQPIIYAFSACCVMFAMGAIFWLYDRFVGHSYPNAIANVERTKSLVDNLFPPTVRDRMLSEKLGQSDGDFTDPLEVSRQSGIISRPIADLHPSVSVIFADIANFTAWSSVREPSQVFLLLETLYNSFDLLTKRYSIFKVETIGDCYVAVSGLPEPNEFHAIDMARFANDIIHQMQRDVKRLEVLLGPDTGDLAMRVGINSGPVTAGVLRGAKSRFQLFGDTVNVASRMESTGDRNMIHISSDTAHLIEKAGKSAWLVPRQDSVQVKGKGEMQTYWLILDDASVIAEVVPDSHSAARKSARVSIIANELDLSSRCDEKSMTSHSMVSPEDKTARLVNWSSDLLVGLLKRIVAMRESEEALEEMKDFHEIVKELDERGGLSSRASMNIDGLKGSRSRREPHIHIDPDNTVLDEVAEIINLPQKKASRYQQDPDNVELPESVIKQVYMFVGEVAKMYRGNPFHNFEHASHVTQSLTKLLSRVVAPNEVDYENMTYKRKAATRKLHKFTFGITSDPITQFACAFSALIHDMDHPGVPNAVLVKEGTEIAKQYRDKSVAEQNSVDLAWSLLMQQRFSDLRKYIYKNQSELVRFRQLVVNSVMATDIVDKELGQLRKNRWERAFSKVSEDESHHHLTEDVNRKATIVIEHLIQAADVAHTMQHWHVYLKWNERFFHECYAVYLSGRSDTDPSVGWYKGEIGFFDFYIIPLAKKLENCGVFGVSSDECLQYATANRDEWERKGEKIVQSYLSKYKKEKE
eukprot:Nitzschia sp. Nitz4//scaffold50_size126154//2557//6191//NITZ4_003666-RA/size126154-augustus-gene-0.111-mRNA-1//1//CDS//3329553641//6064//frame0